MASGTIAASSTSSGDGIDASATRCIAAKLWAIASPSNGSTSTPLTIKRWFVIPRSASSRAASAATARARRSGRVTSASIVTAGSRNTATAPA